MYRTRLIAAFLCCVWSASGFAKADSEAVVLASFQIGGPPDSAFELVVAPCQAGACPLEVRLRRAGKPPRAVRLDWPAPSQTIEPGDQNVAGAGALLSSEKLRSWTVGGNEKGITVGAEPTSLADNSPALLVHQAAGFEHVKRRHYLIVADANGPQRVWRGVERQGPHILGATVVDRPSGAEVLVTDVFVDPSPTRPETVTVRRLQWTRGTLRDLPSRVRLPVAVLGLFQSAAEARAARAGAACLAAYLVLPATRVGQAAGGFVLAALAAKVDTARRAVEDARGCAPSLQGHVSSLRRAA